jgi:hypothetical protein
MTAKTEAHSVTPGRADADGVRSPRCSLDAPGMRRQRARYRGLARSLLQMSRHGDRLVVDFAPDLDRRALEQVLALERECCPFFCFSFDPHLRRLHVSVCESAATPALEALASLLSQPEPGA